MAAIAVTALIEGLWLDLTSGKAQFSPDEADDLATHLIALFFASTSWHRNIRAGVRVYSAQRPLPHSSVNDGRLKGYIMNEDRFDGVATQLDGKIKSKLGNAIGDAGMESEGMANQVKGRAQNLYGSAVDAATDAYDRLPTKARQNIDRAYGKARNHPAITLAVAGGIGLLAFGASHLLMQDQPKRRKKR